MPPSGDVRCVYNPDTLQVMGAAFDTALLSLPPNLQDNEVARRKLALIILRHSPPPRYGAEIRSSPPSIWERGPGA